MFVRTGFIARAWISWCVYDSAFSCKTDVYASDKEMRKEDRWNGLILKCMKTRMSGSRNVSCCRPPPSTPPLCVCVCRKIVFLAKSEE